MATSVAVNLQCDGIWSGLSYATRQGERKKNLLNMTVGICKLTGERGILIKSHIIPNALTKPDHNGAALAQLQSGSRPIRRWTSWYDVGLVTQAGENILTALDTWATNVLRRKLMIWSSWGPMVVLSTADYTPTLGPGFGVRTVSDVDFLRLRLFFLSLLWRSSMTTLPEFAEIFLPKSDTDQLRKMLITSNPHPLSFYPLSLTQLSTIGPIHNMIPITSSLMLPSFKKKAGISVPVIRFYLDGLIVHIHKQAVDDGRLQFMGPMAVGTGLDLVITTVPFESSFERQNLGYIIQESDGPSRRQV